MSHRLRFLFACVVLLGWLRGASLSRAVAQSPEPLPLEGHTDPVYGLDFTPDGSLAVTGSFDKTIRLWDPASRNAVRTLVGHSNLVLSVATSRDGLRLVSGSQDNTVKLWDVPVSKPLQVIPAHAPATRAVA
ncbi:MAG: WD40 repeat domain-containing protein, partial [Planctomycetaceae bacterium]